MPLAKGNGVAKKLRSETERPLKRKRNDTDVDALNQRVLEIDPINDDFDSFGSLPLSQTTAAGIEASHFKSLTDIQRKAIPRALQGADILGAAKTGSGKTLAFLIPVLENLYRQRWTEYDGLGALILSPTRELAIQIFEVLRKIGRFHTFSAGLVIGGKSLKEERDRLGRMDILVCTPGRMLQHMDQTASFDVGNVQMLVLDEADRIMDMGFEKTVDAIVEHLPKKRQTLLFSATQSKRVSDLARLSVTDAEYVAVHETATSATPSSLEQNYILTPLPEKLNTLWSFIRANLKSKILVFFSSGKQVRFTYESFRQMQPGMPLMHLHGRQKQTARYDITHKFHASKHSCLFATDVVARGLDFPAVDWVIQLDCPEDADTYIHRVGRTARFERQGHAVMFLDPSEEAGMLQRLGEKNVTVEMINVRQKKQQDVKKQLQSMCFKDPTLKYLAQKAFVSYVRSIHVQRDKEVFKLKELALEEYAASLGLLGAPRIKFGAGDSIKARKNAPREAMVSSGDDDDGEEDDPDDIKIKAKARNNESKTKYDRMFERSNQDVLTTHYADMLGISGNQDDKPSTKTVENSEDDLYTLKPVPVNESDGSELAADQGEKDVIRSIQLGSSTLNIDSKRREKLLKSKKKIAQLKEKSKKLVFDEDGNAHEIYEFVGEDEFKAAGEPELQKTRYLTTEQEKLREVDMADKAAAKVKQKQKREKRKAREKAILEEQAGGSDGPVLARLPTPEPSEDEHSLADDAAEVEVEADRPKKWFEREGKRAKQQADLNMMAAKSGDGNLQDLEALAMNFLSNK